ncbi:MAG: flagellar hook-associated protein FlgK [Pseudomonadales bacterium]
MSLINIGINGITLSRAALQVTGNNIANADLPSYSRQRLEVATLPEDLQGNGFIGSGAIVENLSRVVDQFLITQIQLDTVTFNRLDVFADNIEQVDSLLANDFSGLGPAVANFFSAIESSAQDPTSEPARQVVVSEADGLAQRINTLTARVEQQVGSVNDQLTSLATQISTIAIGLADLNRAIVEQVGRSSGAQPNQLLDQRDELLRELAEIINVRTVVSGDALNVFVGNGQPLVVENTALSMATVPSSRESGNVEIVFVDQNGFAQQVTDFISGGKMGGLLEFRDDVVSDVLNSLGRIAIGLADTLNQQNALGIDLEGNLGGDIFVDINTGGAAGIPGQRVITDAGNAVPTATMSVNITDVTQLTTSDYVLNVVDKGDGGSLDYQILRLSDNTIVPSPPGTAVSGIAAGIQNILVDGFTIVIPDATRVAVAVNDRFHIRPTRSGGSDMAVDITRVQELAYAVPIVTKAPTTNTGGGLISSGDMLAIVDDTGLTFAPTNPIYSSAGVLAAPILIQFNSATSFTVYENSDPFNPEPLFTDMTFTPGQLNPIFDPLSTGANYIGFQVEISGTPNPGDEFTIEFNANGSSDNRNAIELGGVRTRDVLDNGSTNFENAYGSLIEEIGTRTAQTQVSRDSAESLLAQSQGSRDSISGVNLDEEASNLIKFEQSYNASAQIIRFARQIFESLLAILS